MAHLEILLLGPLQVILDGELVNSFESDKVRALLVYLAVESDCPHRRESLAGLFWPEQPERRARHNLSQALSNLRKAISDRPNCDNCDASDAERTVAPFFLVTHQTVQFNSDSNHSLDMAVLATLLSACEEHDHHRPERCESCVRRLRKAVALYRGPFLERFYGGGSAAFEEWALVKREGLQRQVVEAFSRLVAHHEQRSEYQDACEYARRWVELEPWNEVAQRQLMRILALCGQRSAALRQYQVCCRTLVDELGVEPASKTIELFEQIRDGIFERPRSSRRKMGVKARVPLKSHSWRKRAWAMIFILCLVLGLGLLVGFLKLNSYQTFDDNQTYSPAGQTAIPQVEVQALVTLYNETGGAGWKDSSGWLSDATICTWFGVTCSGEAVTELNLPDNDLSGNIPPEISLLTNLRMLNLEFNQLEGDIPPELGSLSNLEALFLAGNTRLSGTIPPEFGNLMQLEELVLSTEYGGTQFSGSIPSQLGNLRRLTRLELSNSMVDGPIPPALGGLPNLMYLDLSFNQLSGQIPPEMGNLSNLRSLILQGNSQLSGTIPSELGNLVKLELLILSTEQGGTQLSGPIPPELGDLTRLKHLAISNCFVSGPIPPELGNLTDLTYLDLAQIPLSGPIPPELGNLVNLQTLSVGEVANELEGPLPLSLMNLKKLDYFTYGNLTDLCEPPDPAFQEWLNGIRQLAGPRVLCLSDGRSQQLKQVPAPS